MLEEDDSPRILYAQHCGLQYLASWAIVCSEHPTNL